MPIPVIQVFLPLDRFRNWLFQNPAFISYVDRYSLSYIHLPQDGPVVTIDHLVSCCDNSYYWTINVSKDGYRRNPETSVTTKLISRSDGMYWVYAASNVKESRRRAIDGNCFITDPCDLDFYEADALDVRDGFRSISNTSNFILKDDLTEVCNDI